MTRRDEEIQYLKESLDEYPDKVTDPQDIWTLNQLHGRADACYRELSFEQKALEDNNRFSEALDKQLEILTTILVEANNKLNNKGDYSEKA